MNGCRYLLNLIFEIPQVPPVPPLFLSNTYPDPWQMFFCALVQSEKNKIEQLDPNDFTYIDRAADIFFDEWNKSQPQLNKALTTLEWNTVKKYKGFFVKGWFLASTLGIF